MTNLPKEIQEATNAIMYYIKHNTTFQKSFIEGVLVNVFGKYISNKEPIQEKVQVGCIRGIPIYTDDWCKDSLSQLIFGVKYGEYVEPHKPQLGEEEPIPEQEEPMPIHTKDTIEEATQYTKEVFGDVIKQHSKDSKMEEPIEKLKFVLDKVDADGTKYTLSAIDKINELIDAVNYLLSKQK